LKQRQVPDDVRATAPELQSLNPAEQGLKPASVLQESFVVRTAPEPQSSRTRIETRPRNCYRWVGGSDLQSLNPAEQGLKLHSKLDDEAAAILLQSLNPAEQGLKLGHVVVERLRLRTFSRASIQQNKD